MRIVITFFVALFWAPLLFADDDIGVFETILESREAFFPTTRALEQAIGGSRLELHAAHDIRVPGNKHKARIYVLTSPAYLEAAAAEPPRTASALVLRVGVYTTGDQHNTFVNMANPVPQAMIFFADSPNYAALVAAASAAADELRDLVRTIPGDIVSVQTEPRRSESHYNKYKGDGPARMMAKFRTWEKSQLPLIEDTAGHFDAVVDRVLAGLEDDYVSDASQAIGWQVIANIRLRDDVVYLGLTNPFIEDRMISINSRFRKDGKSSLSPYPGVDHVAALPTELLIVREGDDTVVLQYGQMWRMQLYFWDSGYRAFTANMGVPGEIVESIEEAVLE